MVIFNCIFLEKMRILLQNHKICRLRPIFVQNETRIEASDAIDMTFWWPQSAVAHNRRVCLASAIGANVQLKRLSLVCLAGKIGYNSIKISFLLKIPEFLITQSELPTRIFNIPKWGHPIVDGDPECQHS